MVHQRRREDPHKVQQRIPESIHGELVVRGEFQPDGVVQETRVHEHCGGQVDEAAHLHEIEEEAEDEQQDGIKQDAQLGEIVPVDDR